MNILIFVNLALMIILLYLEIESFRRLMRLRIEQRAFLEKREQFEQEMLERLKAYDQR